MNLSQRIRSYFNGDLTANIYEIVALVFEQQDGIAWQGGSVLSGPTYTLSDADNGKILVSSSASVTVIVPNTLTKGFTVTLLQGGALAPITVSTSAPMTLVGNPAVTVTGGEGSYFVFKMISTSPPVGLLTAESGAGATGVTSVANGGTGLTTAPSNGQLLIGNGTGYTQATLTAGSGVAITNGAGSISIAASGGAFSLNVPLLASNGSSSPFVTAGAFFIPSAITPTIVQSAITSALTANGNVRILTAAGVVVYSWQEGGNSTGFRVTSPTGPYSFSSGWHRVEIANFAGNANPVTLLGLRIE